MYYPLSIPVNNVFGRQEGVQKAFSVEMTVEGSQRWEEDIKTVMEGKMELEHWR